MHHYVFILGRVPELSTLEIKEVLVAEHIPVRSLSYGKGALFATTDSPLDCAMLMRRLGGTIKIGEVLEEKIASAAQSPSFFADILEQLAPGQNKITFGVSLYKEEMDSRLRGNDIQEIGLSIKKELRSRGRSVRFVAPKKGAVALSSVVVAKQNVLELMLFGEKHGLHIARTVAVQPFEEFSERDWERPEKSMAVGMLPPKIARAMVNCSGIVSGSADTLLDPFCGLGTILQEALLAGITHVEGSDINSQNVGAAQKNLFWLSQGKNLSLAHVRLRVCDARNLSRLHKPGSIGAIVTEPYLGPIVRQSGIKNLSAVQKDLTGLYRAFLENTQTVLKKGGRIVIVFPVWISGKEKTFLPILKTILPAGFAVAQESILIARPNQHVARELYIFQKN